MFIKITKSKGIEYLNIAEGYRENGKVKHRNIAGLGRLNTLADSGSLETMALKLLALAGTVTSNAFPDSVSEGELFNYGYVAYKRIWAKLKLDALFSLIEKEHTRLRYDLNNAAFLTSVQRLLDPKSKKATYEGQGFYWGLPAVKLETMYRSLEILSDNKERIETHLFEKTRRIRGSLDIIFYDVTTFAFQSVEQDAIRDFGFSKDQKFKEVQVVLGLFMDCDGFPVGYDLFPGNTYDGKTLIPALDRLKAKFDVRRVIIVADRGINSKTNLYEIKKAGYEYIVAARLKNMSAAVKKAIFDDDGYEAVIGAKEIMKVKSVRYDNVVDIGDGSKIIMKENLVLSYSTKRARKDAADRARLVSKAQKLLEKPALIAQNLKQGGRKYIKSSKKEDAKNYALNEHLIEENSKYDGYYGIQCSDLEMSGHDVFQAYHSLVAIEDCFKTMKSTLEARPVFHWSAKRIRGHFVSCYIAFFMGRMLEISLKKKGMPASAERIMDSIASAVVCSFEAGGKLYYLKCKTNETADNIFSVTGVKKLPNLMTAEVLNRMLHLNVV
jgi:transposase